MITTAVRNGHVWSPDERKEIDRLLRDRKRLLKRMTAIDKQLERIQREGTAIKKHCTATADEIRAEAHKHAKKLDQGRDNAAYERAPDGEIHEDHTVLKALASPGTLLPMIHRKSIHGRVWHCCRSCQYWPERRGEYVERNSKPVSGELCELCQFMIREGDCTPLTRVAAGVVRRVDG